MNSFFPRGLVRASGGARYAAAVGVDALGTGMLRPFLLLYGIKVLGLSVTVTGLAMTAGILVGLAGTPAVGRWVDRGARSDVVAAAMVVRVPGVLLLLAAPQRGVAWFTVAALLLGIGNQAFPTAHAALVSTISEGRTRDAALAAGRSIRNAGLGLGALVATVCLAGGTPVLRALAIATGIGYGVAAFLAWSVRITGSPSAPRAQNAADDSPPGMSAILTANVVYAFCLNVPEVALPLVLATQVRASPVWAAAIFVINTVLVVVLQVGVTVAMSRFSRRSALTAAGVVLALSYLGFLLAAPLRENVAAPMILAVSVLCTLGEIMYAGSATALIAASATPSMLGRALSRLQLSTGLGLALSPAVMTALAAHGAAALWVPLAVTTLLAATLIYNSGRRHRVRPSTELATACVRPDEREPIGAVRSGGRRLPAPR